jgi:hypothetical protein
VPERRHAYVQVFAEFDTSEAVYSLRELEQVTFEDHVAPGTDLMDELVGVVQAEKLEGLATISLI